MERKYLGEFEEIVLLIVAGLGDNAYGVTIMHEVIEQTGRIVRLNHVHSCLQRLEDKGMVRSKMGGATSERGGRRKRMFTVTALGNRALNEIQEIRERLWNFGRS